MGDEEGEMEEYWDEDGEEGEWDDAEGEWDEDDDWDDEDEEEDDDEFEGGVAQIRPQMGGRNRMPNCGIHTINIYYPQFYMKQIEMEEFDARPDRYGPSVIGKYTKGIGQIEGRYPTDDEDPVSYSMTNIHRFIERMEKENFNETYKYSEDGKNLKPWNSIGRLDIGSESLVDRSKSMKAYCMDLFERYGDMEANIEGVDMYNACYGGQAAGLCAQNWVESDRWDGRYGVAIATDISEADYFAMFCVGAACTLTLYYPDAPLPHHSHRASCIMHRFDFFKPVGWFHIGPVVDGKYSIDAYMSCVDICYQTLRKKMNDRPLLQISDYNVFHTGGGWHIVKKAFERCMRAENPKMLNDERERYTQEKLLMSANLLKIIGPCHTVSSFLNISSVTMTEWDRALGKILIVFTYGSGCASSMYQLRYDDLPWMDPLAVWKVKFYRDSIYQPAHSYVHAFYVQVWMKFDFRPSGRKQCGIGYESYDLDTYYLMEIDPWGRRFFHRGGMKAGKYTKEQKAKMNDQIFHYDKTENRSMREKFGDLPENGYWGAPKPEDLEKALVISTEDKWKALEFEMTYDEDGDEVGCNPTVTSEARSKRFPTQMNVVIEQVPPMFSQLSMEKDSQQHSYQIVGTWNCMKEAQDMQQNADGSYTVEVTLGVNQWEQFFLIQDRDFSRKIYPAFERSWKDMPCIGPHKGPAQPQYWCINGVPSDDLPDDDAGEPGDKYIVTFRWDNVKKLTWEKAEGGDGLVKDDGKYYISGSWSCWDPVELTKDSMGWKHTIEVQKTPMLLQFSMGRNMDAMQCIYPDVDDGEKGDAFSKVCLNEYGRGKKWDITQGVDGDVFRITLERDPVDASDISVSWEKIESRPLKIPAPRYFLIGTFNNFGANEQFLEMTYNSEKKAFLCDITLTKVPTDFAIVQNKKLEECIHPDKAECSQIQAHQVLGPDDSGEGKSWQIGKSAADKAAEKSVFSIVLQFEPKLGVSWKKKGR